MTNYENRPTTATGMIAESKSKSEFAVATAIHYRFLRQIQYGPARDTLRSLLATESAYIYKNWLSPNGMIPCKLEQWAMWIGMPLTRYKCGLLWLESHGIITLAKTAHGTITHVRIEPDAIYNMIQKDTECGNYIINKDTASDINDYNAITNGKGVAGKDEY